MISFMGHSESMYVASFHPSMPYTTNNQHDAGLYFNPLRAALYSSNLFTQLKPKYLPPKSGPIVAPSTPDSVAQSASLDVAPNSQGHDEQSRTKPSPSPHEPLPSNHAPFAEEQGSEGVNGVTGRATSGSAQTKVTRTSSAVPTRSLHRGL